MSKESIPRLDVEVVVEKGGNGVHDIHDESPFVVR